MKVLFIDTTHPALQCKLEEAGFNCYQMPAPSYELCLSIINNYEGIILRSGIPVDSRLLDRATKLRFVARVGSGMENIDTEEAARRGIICLHAPEGNRDAVGEHAVGMLLALMNNFLRSDKQVRKGHWKREENRGVEIMGKTVAIIGYGNTGSAFARRLSGFDATVIAYDKYKTGYSSQFVYEADMETIFKTADIVSLHVPLTDETDYLVDEHYLRNFTKPIYLINTSRGRVVKTSGLVTMIREKQVIGAALDVLEYEKKSLETLENTSADFAYLVRCKNVIFTPHVAGWTKESAVKLATVLADKILLHFPATGKQ